MRDHSQERKNANDDDDRSQADITVDMLDALKNSLYRHINEEIEKLKENIAKLINKEIDKIKVTKSSTSKPVTRSRDKTSPSSSQLPNVAAVSTPKQELIDIPASDVPKANKIFTRRAPKNCKKSTQFGYKTRQILFPESEDKPRWFNWDEISDFAKNYKIKCEKYQNKNKDLFDWGHKCFEDKVKLSSSNAVKSSNPKLYSIHLNEIINNVPKLYIGKALSTITQRMSNRFNEWRNDLRLERNNPLLEDVMSNDCEFYVTYFDFATTDDSNEDLILTCIETALIRFYFDNEDSDKLYNKQRINRGIVLKLGRLLDDKNQEQFKSMAVGYFLFCQMMKGDDFKWCSYDKWRFDTNDWTRFKCPHENCEDGWTLGTVKYVKKHQKKKHKGPMLPVEPLKCPSCDLTYESRKGANGHFQKKHTNQS